MVTDGVSLRRSNDLCSITLTRENENLEFITKRLTCEKEGTGKTDEWEI